jgi:hypothetical protein
VNIKPFLDVLTILLQILFYVGVVLYYPVKLLIWIHSWLRHLDPRYLYCRIRHGKPEPYKYWEMAPFGIGGGFNKYYSRCPVCERKHWTLSREEYVKMGGENPGSPY